jgi:hypothetical protein
MVALVAGLATLTAYAGEEGVRAVDTKGLKLGDGKGKVSEPTVITSAAELAKAIADDEAQTKIKGQVDFAKEKLLFFKWSGSGGDKLGFKTNKGDKGLEVTILLKPGLTRDLRQHHQLFVLPKDATWKFEVGKPGN